MGKSFFKTRVILFLTALLLCSMAGLSNAEDELNCVLCHKHRGLSRIDENGNLRLFYINEHMFEEGPHFRVKCIDCHQDIAKIPHDPAKKVDCTTECHLTEPSGQKNFSHKSVAEQLNKSVHGKFDTEGKEKKNVQDFPGCKDCHEEPLYRPLSFFKGKAGGISQRGISRCKTCHRTGKFAESFYKHVTSRLQKTRQPVEMVQVCDRCHSDKDLQQRHNLDDVVNTYKETFHYKAIKFGSDETPDCLDCHVVKGESVHFIEGRNSPTAANNNKNVATTCRTSECHDKASENLAGYRVHVTYDKDKYPFLHYMMMFFTGLMAAVMYFFLVLIILELLRRLFPNFSFTKSPDDGHH